MSLGVGAQDLFIGHGQRFEPIDFQFRLAFQFFDGTQYALWPFGVSGFAIFRAAIVRDDFHGRKLPTDKINFTEYIFDQNHRSSGLNFKDR